MGFYKLEQTLMARKDLRLAEKVILAMVTKEEWGREYAEIGQERFANELGQTTKSVRRSIDALVSLGLIEVSRTGKNSSNRYRTTDGTNLPVKTGNPDPSRWDTTTHQTGNPDLSDRSFCPIHKVVDLIDSLEPTYHWWVGLKGRLRGLDGYAWDEARDGHSSALLEALAEKKKICRECFNDALALVWSEYESGKVRSLPSVLHFRLKEKYG